MSIELEEIDCNCNDCLFMIRDMDKFKASLEFHKKIQLEDFTRYKNKLYKHSIAQRRKGNLEAYEMLSKEHDKLKFQFDKKQITVNYGVCERKCENVSFIPRIMQVETQDCFIHRSKKIIEL